MLKSRIVIEWEPGVEGVTVSGELNGTTVKEVDKVLGTAFEVIMTEALEGAKEQELLN